MPQERNERDTVGRAKEVAMTETGETYMPPVLAVVGSFTEDTLGATGSKRDFGFNDQQ